jgi:beta-exotoxin I transport system ATP-binding protein
MGDGAIQAEGLTKYFGEVIGVEDLSFTVAQGEVYGFLGANGAGKTTTIRLLLDLLRPTRGRVTVRGFDCQRQSLEARRQIGYLPGDFPVYPDLTAGGYLDYLATLDGRSVSRRYLQELLARFDVSALDLRRRLRDQSHGMKQKIGIIQALMGGAPVLVLDEPTAGLDPLMVQAFRELLDTLKKDGDTTVFLSSHMLTEVEATCDRIGVIRAGRMVATGTIQELKRHAARRMTVDFRESVANRTLPSLPGVELLHRTEHQWILSVRGPVGPLIQILASYPVHDVSLEEFNLEEYVVKHYAKG